MNGKNEILIYFDWVNRIDSLSFLIVVMNRVLNVIFSVLISVIFKMF